MDQSGLNFEIPPKKTIEIIGSQQVSIATSGSEKKRVTVISLISCAGMKFPQLVIFKGTPGARVERKVKSYNDTMNVFTVQENAWTDKEQLENWLKFVWHPIASSTQRPKLLLLDSLPLHKDLKKEFEKFHTRVMYIPKGLTWTLQPLDSLYHRTYKNYARECFMVHQLRGNVSEEDRRKQVIDNVKEIHGKISEEIIKSSWRHVGLDHPRRIHSQVIINDPIQNGESSMENKMFYFESLFFNLESMKLKVFFE